jgi:dCMP deaminase
MKKAILLYMPVIHKGYLEFLCRHANRLHDCFLIGRKALASLGPEADYIRRKDAAIRAIPDEIVRGFIRERGLYGAVCLLECSVRIRYMEVIGPDEDVTCLAARHFFPNVPLRTDDSVRLRYDRKGVARVDPVPSTETTAEECHKLLMEKVVEMAGRSKDWWLSVGALVARDGRILFTAYNRAMPDADTPAVLGDPRSLYSRGENTDDTLVHHAERAVVAQAARDGVSLLGADAYVTHFPCVPCASDLVVAGIRRLFFREGYSRLESASVLQAGGVEIFRVLA